jgi:hypothetical protein
MPAAPSDRGHSGALRRRHTPRTLHGALAVFRTSPFSDASTLFVMAKSKIQ